VLMIAAYIVGANVLDGLVEVAGVLFGDRKHCDGDVLHTLGREPVCPKAFAISASGGIIVDPKITQQFT